MSKLSSDALLAAKRRLLEHDEIIISKSSKRSDESDKKHKKRKKEKKSKKDKKTKKKSHSSSDSSSSSEDSDTWVEAASKKSPDDQKIQREDSPEEQPVTKEALKRDDWMSITGLFATFTRDDIKPKKDNKKKNIDDYDPGKSVRELNPYWKDGGTGLPSENKEDSRRTHQQSNRQDYSHSRSYNRDFDRPNYHRDSDRRLGFKKPSHGDDEGSYRSNYSRDDYRSSSKNWKKRRDSPEYRRDTEKYSDRNNSRRERSPECERNRDRYNDRRSRDESRDSSSPNNQPSTSYSDSKNASGQSAVQDDDSSKQKDEEKTPYLTDQQMNAIGAKIVKAEIMGNKDLVAKLTAKLNAAREYKKLNPNAGKKDDAVMLTLTDEKGNVRPLTKSEKAGDPRSKGGKKKITTHAVTGERTRFFEDDDKYSLTQMFEKEKFGSSYDGEKEFAETISKHRNPNDDLEDIFAEKITKTKSDAKIDEQNKRKAIAQHKTVKKSLDNCEYCVDSEKMLKHLIVSLGTKAYVALPARKSLTEGHCYIATVGHVTCSTMADEDVWEEIMTYRRALTRLFNSRDEDVVFFETAVHFHKYPHLVINCVPLPRDVGDSAPIYFKKAIMECETEWSNNKKVVDLKGKDVRRGVPQRLPYFWVDFGMDPGFAHVIEDQNQFPNNFAQEIVGGMLDLDHCLWRKPIRENFDSQRKKVLQFETIWKEFDPQNSS